MKKLVLFFLIMISVQSCNSERQEINLQEKLRTEGVKSSKAMDIFFAQPIIIDSSHLIMYPLILEKSSYSGSLSSGYSDKTNFWNIIFYNVETSSKQLLTTDQKILITSINNDISSSSGFTEDEITIIDRSIFYNVITKDFNQNNQLDEDDLTYLFISDKEGKNLRQISPPDYNIQRWEVVKGTNKIIMEAQKDENNDKKITENDGNIPFIIDVALGNSPIQIFGNAYSDSLKNILMNNWKPIK